MEAWAGEGISSFTLGQGMGSRLHLEQNTPSVRSNWFVDAVIPNHREAWAGSEGRERKKKTHLQVFLWPLEKGQRWGLAASRKSIKINPKKTRWPVNCPRRCRIVSLLRSSMMWRENPHRSWNPSQELYRILAPTLTTCVTSGKLPRVPRLFYHPGKRQKIDHSTHAQ